MNERKKAKKNRDEIFSFICAFPSSRRRIRRKRKQANRVFKQIPTLFLYKEIKSFSFIFLS